MSGPTDIDPRLLPLVPAYLAARREDCRALAAAVDHAAWSTVGDIGHRLAGSGGSYGYPLISSLGGQLEAAAEACDERAARGALSALERAVEAGLEAFEAR